MTVTTTTEIAVSITVAPVPTENAAPLLRACTR